MTNALDKVGDEQILAMGWSFRQLQQYRRGYADGAAGVYEPPGGLTDLGIAKRAAMPDPALNYGGPSRETQELEAYDMGHQSGLLEAQHKEELGDAPFAPFLYGPTTASVTSTQAESMDDYARIAKENDDAFDAARRADGAPPRDRSEP